LRSELKASIESEMPHVKGNRPSKRLLTPRLIGAMVGIAAGLLLFLEPRLHHIQSSTRAVISVLGLSVVFWVFQVFENHVVGLLMCALLLLVGVPPNLVFSGFAASTFWLLFVALYFGFAMQNTGLARRVALTVFQFFKPSYMSILFAFFLIGTLLSLGIPAFVLRIAIMISLAWSIVKSASLPERSAASALIVISAFEMAVIPGFGTLTGSTIGVLFVPLLRGLGLQISWVEYAKTAAIPVFMCSILVLAGNLLVIRPEIQLGSGFFPSRELSEMGKLSRDEKWTLLIISGSVALWATQRFHQIDEASIALFALIALTIAGIVKPQDFEKGISWGLVIFIGTTITVLRVMPAYGIDKLVGGIIIDTVSPYLVNASAALVVVAVAVFVLRIIEPAGAVSTMVVFVALYGPLMKLGISYVVSEVAAILAFTPFWFLYQNIWLVMSDGLTEHRAFTAKQQVKLATIYAVAVILTLIICFGYWRAIGLISKP
jgi:anion transporter